ncbi:UNVERIFIED_CONTAM: hypothetical protein PYX00_009203 [Menopon gallinae]|uniref:Uncharacterized protein n=1 Tax=Menopon gallinae TaxID=328185 RepID=A0AAW2HAE1_9NEOP
MRSRGVSLQMLLWLTEFLDYHRIRVKNLIFSDKKCDDQLLLSTTELSLAATDNGMTLGEIPEQLTTGSVVHDLVANDEDSTVKLPSTSTFLQVELPENHKNYSGTPYVSSIELPPLLNQFNEYQQYRNYYKQKNEYKPLKFEANSAKNHYLPHGLGSYVDDDARHRYEEVKFNREPFPYSYENEKIPFLAQSIWTGYNGVEPQNEVEGYNYQYHVKPEVHQVSKNGHTDVYGWKKALKFFTALVPLGLLLATFTPSVISINSTVDQKPTRQRSLTEGVNITGEAIKQFFRREYNLTNTDPDCEMAEICNLYRRGEDSPALKNFWQLAKETPDDVAEQMGLKKLFHAIRDNHCEVYKCLKKKKKKVIQKISKKKRV